MEIKVYSKANCPQCVLAKNYLNQRGYEFQVVSLDDPDEKEKFVQANPGVRTVPQIFIDGERIGGFQELQKYNIPMKAIA